MEPNLTPQDRAALAAFAEKVIAQDGGQVRAIILFGSKARGDAHPESDTDVLVLCDSDDPETKRRFWRLAFDVLLDCGAYLSVRAMSLARWRELAARRPQLYANLVRDGIVVYAHPDAPLPEFTSISDVLAPIAV